MNTKASTIFADDAPLTPNYAAMDAEDQRRENVWLNRFPWLTDKERSVYNLADHPAFPGAYAEEHEYDTFAAQLRRESARRVPCLFMLGWGNVRGAVELVSGATYLQDGKSYVLGQELPSSVTIAFDDDDSRATLTKVLLKGGVIQVSPAGSPQTAQGVSLGALLNRDARPVSVTSIGNIVEHLARVGKLPPVTAVFNA
jgi:hypothetical protein